MAKRIFEFICEQNHITEALVDDESRTIKCRDCSGVATRMISMPAIKLEGWSGSFPGAANKFDRLHRDKLKAELKAKS